VGSAATVLVGHPLAQKGEASRALGAAFFASLLGGLIGAALLGLSIPMLRPFMLAIATPELLAFCIFGLSLVAALSGGNALKGVAAACLGLLLAAVGEDSQAGELRWTFGSVYLWDGLALVPLALGLFALPELAELYARRTGIAEGADAAERAAQVTQLDGVRDVIRRPFLLSRCAAIGSLLGAVPGVGSAVIDWVAYGHAARTEKGAQETFGTGDIRGVIASESSNNAKEGGALVPTIAFGVPGSASMALLLGAFTAQGIVPGPRMLSDHLDVTYALV
jgi:TctA family transporter